MRRERFAWSFLVIGVLLVLYGGFFMFYYNQKNQSIFVSAIIAFAIGLIMLIGYSILYLLSHKKNKQVISKVEEEEIKEDEEIKEETKVVEDKPKPSIYKYDDIEYVPSSRSSSIYDSYTSYVRKVGYGPILEINGNRIKDMRNNIYYRNEKGKIYQDGGGLIYDICSNRIRSIYGNQLYEISGNNINKVFGGYYASISGNYLTKYDGTEKYELGDRYSSNMLLLIAVLVFGE